MYHDVIGIKKKRRTPEVTNWSLRKNKYTSLAKISLCVKLNVRLCMIEGVEVWPRIE